MPWLCYGPTVRAVRRPNVLLIVAGDMNWDTPGCFGLRSVMTFSSKSAEFSAFRMSKPGRRWLYVITLYAVGLACIYAWRLF